MASYLKPDGSFNRAAIFERARKEFREAQRKGRVPRDWRWCLKLAWRVARFEREQHRIAASALAWPASDDFKIPPTYVPARRQGVGLTSAKMERPPCHS